MSSISQVSDALRRVLTTRAKELERATGFVERSTVQLDGPTFVQTTVFGWMDNPEASYAQLRHVAASLGVSVSNQAVAQRFGVESAALLRQLLQEAVGEVLSSEASAPELLRRFNGVDVQDGTSITLPAALRDEWRGCGGSTPDVGQSSMRVQVRLDLAQGGMQGPWLQEGRAPERSGEAHEAPLPQGCLYNVDAGYFTLAEMRAHGQAGCYWLTAATASTLLIDERGQCWDLVSFLGAQRADEVDVQVCLGKHERLPVRLVARRVSPEQAERRRKHATGIVARRAKGVQRPNAKTRRPTNGRRPRTRRKTSKARLQLLGWMIMITNVPKELLSIDEVLVLARCRWPIELCWKLWKQVGKVDTWRSAKPYRILTEIYAKLLGCLITHWVTLLECWQAPNRSMVKARQAMQWMAPVLALGVADVVPLEMAVQRTSSTMASGCTVNARRKRPAAYQLVEHPKLIRGLG